MDKVRVTELGYLEFEVRDPGAWRAWAGEILGMEVIEEREGGRAGARLRLDDWHQRIVLREGPSDDLSCAGFRLAGPEDFRAMQRQLTDQGVAFEIASPAEAEQRHVLEVLRLEDPTGIPIELFHGPQVDRHAPMRPGRGMHGKFRSGDAGLGHMVIAERGMEASERFYRDVLGMRGSIETKADMGGHRIELMFLHCNSRGHSVAFGLPGLTKRIQHFMVEVEALDDVGLAFELAQRNKVPILLGLGRHANDGMLSFYMQTPSGFFCEYGWGGRPALAQSEYNPADIWGHDVLDPSLLG